MELSIQKLSKAFNQKVIFQDIDLDIPTGSRIAITGPNGSGKSTLLKIISGGTLPSGGSIRYRISGKKIAEDQVYKFVHFAAPYNTMIEELTLPELFSFHQDLGTLYHYSSYRDWILDLEYPFKNNAVIKTFSSGMKQRIKLGLTILDSRPLLLLDEPSSNLDAQGKDWMFEKLGKLSSSQTLFIATNDQRERAFCNQAIDLTTYSSR